MLESLIERECSEDLREKMSKCTKDIERFRQKTRILECACHLVKKRTIPTHFKKVILEHNIDPDNYTLAELDTFRKDTLSAHHLKLSECAFQAYTCSIKHHTNIRFTSCIIHYLL